MVKNLLYLFALLMYPIGIFNGTYYAVCAGEWPTVIGIIFLAAMAWTTERRLFEKIFVDDDTY